MKIMMTTLAMLSTMTLAAAASAADCEGVRCTDVAITRIFATASGDISYYVDGDTRGLSCTDEQRGYLTLPGAHPNFDSISQMALSLYLARQRVQFRMDETTCDIDYLVVDAQ